MGSKKLTDVPVPSEWLSSHPGKGNVPANVDTEVERLNSIPWIDPPIHDLQSTCAEVVVVDSSFSPQEKMMQLKRNTKKMCRILFNFSSIPIGKYYYFGLGKPYIYHNFVYFTSIGEDCGGVSDCEELVGVTHRGRKKKDWNEDE